MYKVLLVDDEPIILDGMRILINWEELGLEVAGAVNSGTEAIEFFDNNVVDILITDMKMPDVNGLQLINAVKRKHSDVKVIILSGYDDFEYVKEAAKLGIENYLLKPVNDEELLSTLLLITKKLENEAICLQRQRQDSTIIRDNILLRWVTNTIGANELESRGDVLGLITKGTNFVSSIVHCAGRRECDGNQYPERYQPIITSVCASIVGRNAYVFRNLDGDIVLLFHFDGIDSDYSAMLASLNDIIKEISRQVGQSVFILVGSMQTSYENAYLSYMDALKLMDYTLILSGSHVVEYNHTQQEMNRLETEFIDFDELKKFITNKDISSVHRLIGDAYSCLSTFELLTPGMLRNETLRMGLFILNTVNMTKTMGRGFPDGSDSVFADIWERKSLQEQEAWVKGVADRAVAILLSADRNFSPVVKKVVQYIDANYDKEIALKCIASLLNMNAVYLGQLFKNETGVMFTVYLNDKRVEEAKRLLLATKMNVVDIGVKVGYSNNNHFFSVFKKLMGVSPTEYRRLNMKF